MRHVTYEEKAGKFIKRVVNLGFVRMRIVILTQRCSQQPKHLIYVFTDTNRYSWKQKEKTLLRYGFKNIHKNIVESSISSEPFMLTGKENHKNF